MPNKPITTSKTSQNVTPVKDAKITAKHSTKKNVVKWLILPIKKLPDYGIRTVTVYSFDGNKTFKIKRRDHKRNKLWVSENV